jgi:hypothetical protein
MKLSIVENKIKIEIEVELTDLVNLNKIIAALSSVGTKEVRIVEEVKVEEVPVVVKEVKKEEVAEKPKKAGKATKPKASTFEAYDRTNKIHAKEFKKIAELYLAEKFNDYLASGKLKEISTKLVGNDFIDANDGMVSSEFIDTLKNLL